MKKLQITIAALAFCLLATFTASAQAPQAFNYQGVARSTEGKAMANQKMTLRLSIIDGAENGEVVYQETQEVTTNQYGLYNIQIGTGTGTFGDFKTIAWEKSNKYIRVEVDMLSGAGFEQLATTQLLSVPYALYANSAGTADQANNVRQTRAGNANYLSKFDASGSSSAEINSQLFDNGTSVGLGTITPDPSTKLQINRTGNGAYIRMVNTDPTGVGTFRLINDVPSNFATFSKYGSTVSGGYSGIATLYPFANILGYGNNGPFLNAGTGNIGFAITKAGTNKLKIHIDAASENVGFGGNSVPQALVHINTTDRASDTLKMTNNTTGHGVGDGFDIRQTGNTVRMVNLEPTGNTIIGTNGADRLTIDAAGNVGIGTNSPTAKLEVNGQVKITGGVPGAGKVLTSDATGLATWQTPSGGSGGGQWTATGTNISNTNTGNVGIGITTPNTYGHGGTNKILEIRNSDNTADAQSQLILSSAATSGGSIGGITWIPTNTTFSSDVRGAYMGSVWDDVTDRSDLRFWTNNGSQLLHQMTINPDGGVRVEGPVASGSSTPALSLGGYGDISVDAPFTPGGRFMINENGHVGIGTSNPYLRLDVASTSPWVARFKNNGTGSDYSSIIHLETGDFFYKSWRYGIAGGNSSIGLNNGEFFWEHPVGGIKMMLDPNGNLGIGYNSTSYKLAVNGSTLVAPNSLLNSGLVVGENVSGTAIYKMIVHPDTAQSGMLISSNVNTDYNLFSNYEAANENGVFRNTKLNGGSTSVSGINFSNTDSATVFRAYAPDGAVGLDVQTKGPGIKVNSSAAQPGRFVATSNSFNPTLTDGALSGVYAGTYVADYIGTRGQSVPSLTSNYGVGVEGLGGYIGVRAYGGAASTNSSSFVYGSYGYAQNLGSGNTYGIYGTTSAPASANHYAGYFSGKIYATSGTFGTKPFTIDHPLDPENKVLRHSSIESPDMMNIYNGNIVTDSNGFATITMPDYFSALNKDFKYQLTVIGTFAQAIIKQKMNNNQFVIQTNQPNVEVSWQVSGIRHDAVATKYPIIVEEEKSENNKGKYFEPEAYGQPRTKAISYDAKSETSTGILGK
ncbi:MAG: hypothetical protein RL660_2182 [Bacteroidota bacterium]|jgi:hypothetical protein